MMMSLFFLYLWHNDNLKPINDENETFFSFAVSDGSPLDH